MAPYSVSFKEENAHEDSIWAVAWRKNEKDGTENIVSGGIDDIVKCWRWQNDKLDHQYTFEGHQLGIVSVAINNAGTLAASSSLDSHVKIWDLENGKQIKSIDLGPGYQDHDDQIFSAIKKRDKLNETFDTWTLTFSPDSKQIVTGSHAGKVNLVGIESGQKEETLDTRSKFTMSIAYSPDGRYVACGAIDGIVNIFDMSTRKLLHTLEGHAMPIRSLTFSPDSQLLVTASDDGHLKMYDVQHANLAGTLSGHGSWVLSVDFSPDNTHFVSGSSDKSVKVWDAGSRQCVQTFYEHSDQVWGVCYNSNGSKIVSASDDKALVVYDVPI